MRWTERQQAMLEAMGLRQWAPAVGPRGEAATSIEAATSTASAAVFAAAPTAASAAATVSETLLAVAPAAVSTMRSAAALSMAGAVASEPAVAGDAALRSVPHGSSDGPRSTVAGAMQAPLQAAFAAVPDAAEWQLLRAAVAACRACALCEGRTQTVFGAGHLDAPWLVVGEAPGEEEDRAGEPFVAGPGLLLDRMLAALGLDRSGDGLATGSSRSAAGAAVDARRFTASAALLARRVYVTNVLKCRPPRNRAPSASELAACEPHLLRQVALLRPRLILAMGRCAVQALTRSDEPIGRLRGRVHSFHGVPLVVTYHPAYLQRNPLDKAGAWEDLCLAAMAFEQSATQMPLAVTAISATP